MIAAENLVGSLTALHHLDMLGHGLAEQVKADAVMADHGFVHGPQAMVEGRQDLFVPCFDFVVPGLIFLISVRMVCGAGTTEWNVM